MSNEMNKFSHWLMAQLSEKNMSQSQLARDTGLSRQAISYFIKGEGKRPEDETLRLIAKALKVTIDEIYRGAGIYNVIRVLKILRNITQCLPIILPFLFFFFS